MRQAWRCGKCHETGCVEYAEHAKSQVVIDAIMDSHAGKSPECDGMDDCTFIGGPPAACEGSITPPQAGAAVRSYLARKSI